jgi:hypothetical protein
MKALHCGLHARSFTVDFIPGNGRFDIPEHDGRSFTAREQRQPVVDLVAR